MKQVGICEITSEHRSLQHSDIGNIAPAYKTPQISATSKDIWASAVWVVGLVIKRYCVVFSNRTCVVVFIPQNWLNIGTKEKYAFINLVDFIEDFLTRWNDGTWSPFFVNENTLAHAFLFIEKEKT